MLPYCLGLLSLTPKPVQIAISRRTCVYCTCKTCIVVVAPSMLLLSPFFRLTLCLPVFFGTRKRIKNDRKGCREIDNSGNIALFNSSTMYCGRHASTQSTFATSYIYRLTINVKHYLIGYTDESFILEHILLNYILMTITFYS